MSVLAKAIAAKNWELAALLLLVGMLRALSLPEDTADGLVDVLGGANGEEEG